MAEESPLDPGASAPVGELDLADIFLRHAPIGFALLDTELRYIRVNAALAAMHEVAAGAHVGRTVVEVLGGRQGADLAALLSRVLEGESVVDLELDGPPDARGRLRRFSVTYVPLRASASGPVAGVAGLVLEITERRAVEEALRLAEGRVQLALEGTGTGSFEWDVVADEVRWSENLGPLRGEARGWHPTTYEHWLSTVHPDDRPMMDSLARRAASTGEGYEQEFRMLVAGGQVRWAETRAHVVLDDAGRPAVVVGLVSDVTERRRRDAAARFLAQAGLELARSLDIHTTLRRVAELAVPDLADWCSVTLAEPGSLVPVAVAHVEPAKRRLVEELQRRYPPDPDAPIGVPQVLRTGRSELYEQIGDDLLAQAASDEEHLRLLRELDLHSAMVVALTARGRSLGAVTFVYAGSARAYGEHDLELAEELGRRAGLALDNARLHEQARQTAERLQRSLLPELPDAPGLDIAAAYRPGEDGTQVGGDLYDVFALPDGRHAIVVGDVVGRGLEAAARMGELRSWLRAHAIRRIDPAEVLVDLDQTIAQLGGVSFATCAITFLDAATGRAEHASAGHLAPLVLSEGGCEVMATRTGPPLGYYGGVRATSAFTVPAGATLVLFTDGLVERRGEVVDAGLHRLLRAAPALLSQPLAEGTGRLVAELVDDEHDDDVTLLTVRPR